MPEASALPPRRSPLDSVWAPGDHGTPGPSGPGVTMSRRLGLAAIQIDARRGSADAVARAVADTFSLTLPGPGRAVSGDECRALWLGPDRWLLLAPDGTDLENRLLAAAQPVGGLVVDQGHGRAIVRIEGPASRAMLSKGTGIDLHPRVFPENAVAQTGLFHRSVTIDRRRGTGRFDIHVMRGFALSLHESLCEAAAEFGYRLA